MQHLNLQQAADYLESSVIESTTDVGHVLVHTGISAAGTRFVLANDFRGHTVLIEAA